MRRFGESETKRYYADAIVATRTERRNKSFIRELPLATKVSKRKKRRLDFWNDWSNMK